MKSQRIVVAATTLGLALVPAALAKKPDHPGSQGKGHGKPAEARNVVFKGIVVSSDATTLVVDVPAPKGHGKGLTKKPRGEFTLPLAGAKVTVADTDGSGIADGADIAGGDKVVVQARVLDGVYTVRHVVDRTHPPEGGDEGSDDDAETLAPIVPEAPTA